MAYTPTTWTDEQTELSAANMNHIEQGIASVSNSTYTKTEADGKFANKEYYGDASMMVGTRDDGIAIGVNSASIGEENGVSGVNSLAVGEDCRATAEQSVAIGNNARANGSNSFAGGFDTCAKKDSDFAFGRHLTTEGMNANNPVVVFGQHNAVDSNVIFAIGNGTNDSNKSNALWVEKDGRTHINECLYTKDIEATASIQTTSDVYAEGTIEANGFIKTWDDVLIATDGDDISLKDLNTSFNTLKNNVDNGTAFKNVDAKFEAIQTKNDLESGGDLFTKGDLRVVDSEYNDKFRVNNLDGSVESKGDIIANEGSDTEVSLSTLNDEKDNILSQLSTKANENVISDAYSSSTTYSNGDFCIYQNKLWKSKVNTNVGNVPVEGSYWTETRVGSEIKGVDVSNCFNFVAWYEGTNAGGLKAYKIGKIVYMSYYIDLRGKDTFSAWNYLGCFEVSDSNLIPPLGVRNYLFGYEDDNNRVAGNELYPYGNTIGVDYMGASTSDECAIFVSGTYICRG